MTISRSKPMNRGTSQLLRNGLSGKAPAAPKPVLVKKPAAEPKPSPGPRLRKCAVCKELFTPRSMTHKACGPSCAEKHAESVKKKQERKADRVRRVALKTRQDWLREAQAAFNAFIRTRDHDQPCISCGRFHDGSYDAGHYRSVGAAPALRFNENNCHKQCVPCNQHKGGNIVEYRIRLVEKIGRFAVELLEQEPPPAKFTIEQAQEIKAHYTAKTRQLKAGM